MSSNLRRWNGQEYVTVRPTRVVPIVAADVRQPSWRVWSKPRGQRPGEYQGERTRVGATR